ncbi:glycoside hydrolase family 127 protein [Pseudactinotalea suaedae]|uniref:glycoside hydrolase family 127 protein n=1 Tax=Pseudactinotalea suaedae TaxID=1524924 RepID=UPI0012E1A0F2|nr:beta-L-arabinofuranosidase domain-containing protein [Pseudactinotalea suaedae]
MLTDTRASAHALMSSAPAGSVAIDGRAPMAAMHADALTTTIPTMGRIFFDRDRAHAYQNFLVAGGVTDGTHGTHRGAPFMDGDLYKWLEAAAVAASESGAEDLVRFVDKAADAVVGAQRDDGYIQSKTTVRERDGGPGPLADRLDFETYNFGHLMTLACIAYRASGDDRFLGVARRLGDWVIQAVAERPERFSDCNICPSHYMGTVELARTTGDARYTALAARLIELHGGKGRAGSDDNQDQLAAADQRVAAGHAVRANYLYAGMTDVVLETGDPALREAIDSLWDDLVGRKLYITGGCGALYDGASPDAAQDYWSVTKVHQSYGRSYQLPQTTAYNESCASIGFIMWAWRMLALTGEARFADEIERVLLNALPAMIGADAMTYLYTNPLRQVRDLPYELRRAGDQLRATEGVRPSHVRPRQAFMDSSFCCPPNIARALAELPYYVYGTAADGVWVHQFVSGSFQATVDGVALRLEQSTSYPVAGSVTIRVRAERPVRAAVRVRVPGWAGDEARVSVDGEAISAVEHGYAVIEREWSDATITLELPMDPRLVVAHHFVEEATNQVAAMRGPIVYCLEEADLPEGVAIDEVYLPRSIELSTAEGDGPFAGYAVLEGVARRVPRLVPGGTLYGELPAVEPEELPVRLVPYGRWGNRGDGEMSVWLPVMW